ncbi:MAG: hypothetical protein CMK32_06370 [Porticoccaceae bacterium]|nr:hypothetical protein [Porticoccaceae bacterium]
MSLSTLIGALGLFLLGMWLLTEGLKLAGGRMLQHMLGTWTSTRIRGFFAGLLVTVMAQSSSAVTVAAIGFVNAQLMAFSQSVWVIFGSNVGTTLTAWIVVLFGLKFSIAAFTFPLIGIGAFFRVFSPYERGRALGMALAGFGILFMGIDALRDGFAGVSDTHWLLAHIQDVQHPLLWGFVLGLVLTVMTQASLAAIAIILAAIASGLAGLDMAAAAVIGANIGTTSTALLASIGATANARRLAWAHVLFNLLTGAVALLLLPVFLSLVSLLGLDTYSAANTTFLVAMFHSAFNILGVVVMWPLEPYLTTFLQRRFRESRPRHQAEFLDDNIATVPDLALRALGAQLHSVAADVVGMRLESIVEASEPPAELAHQAQVLSEVDNYIETVSRTSLSENLAEQLTAGLALQHYFHNGLQAIVQMREQYANLNSEWLKDEVGRWLGAISDYGQELYRKDVTLAQQDWQELLVDYQQLKNRILAAAARSSLAVSEVDAGLQVLSLSKRWAEQLLHTLNRFAVLDSGFKARAEEPAPEPDIGGAGGVTPEDTPAKAEV